MCAMDSKDWFKDREHGLEEEYFWRKEQEIIARLREEGRREKERHVLEDEHRSTAHDRVETARERLALMTLDIEMDDGDPPFGRYHGVDGDDGTLEGQHLQKLGNSRDFVGLLVHHDLAHISRVNAVARFLAEQIKSDQAFLLGE